MSLFEGSGLPFGPINNMEQVFADEQVNQLIVRIRMLEGPCVTKFGI